MPPTEDTDSFDIDRFVTAQAPVYEQVVRELRDGRKRTHWMWFVFPQLEGLGRSEMARRYALRSLTEAATYAEHPLLGARLRECTTLVLQHSTMPLVRIFGSIDALKFCSSMTLFAMAAQGDTVFRHAIEHCCGGQMDDATLRLLEGR
jgi:uncharacterized protein (DUF1810 family)